MAREWDAQSLHAESASPFFPPVGAGMGSSGSPGATVEYLRDLVQKRIITLTYMRNVHDGYVCDVWLSILCLLTLFLSLPPP